MTTLTIRNLDGPVRGRIKQRAAANGRSMEAEIRATLTTIYAERNLGQALIDLGDHLRRELGGTDLPELPKTPARTVDLGQ